MRHNAALSHIDAGGTTSADLSLPQQKMDLTACDTEPIHIPGSIQPHGVLLVIKEPELTVVQVSANTSEHFGVGPEALLGQRIDLLLGEKEMNLFQAEVLPQDLEAAPQYLPPIPLGSNGRIFERIIHRYQGQLILEFEWMMDTATTSILHSGAMKLALARLQRAPNSREFCQMAAEEVRRFTGFEHVMVYKFLDDGAGVVIGEALSSGVESYLGLHYPAADIPQQARALYLKSWLRFKVDVADYSVPLVPHLNPISNAPLDLSYSVLRAMSPIHTEYLKNIGAKATMSLSIIREGKLWGLIACHHRSGSKYVPHNNRMSAEILAHMLSLQMTAKEDGEIHDYVLRLKTAQLALVEMMSAAADYKEGLLSAAADFVNWLNAGGVAFCDKYGVQSLGTTPDASWIADLTAWLAKNMTEEIYATDSLSRSCAAFSDCSATAAGLLALRLGDSEPRYILWFRPEKAQAVHWAGDPSKSVEAEDSGVRLTPRKSFALWVEQVKGRSVPWLACELEAVRSLRCSIYEIMARKADEIARLNVELERSNIELDSFTYVASHDLKEPLRGIHNYAHFLLEDHADKLDEQGIDKLKTLTKLTLRMETLIDSLLHYSRLGRNELEEDEVTIQTAIENALEMVAYRIIESGVEIRIPRPVNVGRVRPSRISEVFTNLLTNAIKYNDKAQKWVEIGYIESRALANEHAQTVFYVRDNGIGIAEEYHQHIFQIFRRLHGRDEYGGGSGAGLTIVRRIIEQQGGQIWLESTPGQGTTFYFTLGPEGGIVSGVK